MLCFVGAYYFWRLGDQRAGKTAAGAQSAESRITQHAPRPALPFQLLTQAGNLNTPPAAEPDTDHAPRNTDPLALRLSNTAATLEELQGSDQAILLENAMLDTAQALPAIPDYLRAQGDPGAYVVQARGPVDNAFRARLQGAGAEIVSYIPNNAYLVRAAAGVAAQLRSAPETQAVLPYEPYYKLKPSLLRLAVAQNPLPPGSALNVLLFADARAATRAELEKLGARVAGDEERSPFGVVVTVLPPADGLAALAGLPGVQSVEWALRRVPVNDYSRVRIGVATDVVTTESYLGLKGSNVLVNINDSGVDATHPDLSPRVSGDTTNALVDVNGHGTHVAGIIVSSGEQSATVSNACSPAGPYQGTNTQFRGKAPAASLYSLPLGMFTKPGTDGSTLGWPSDSYLQESAARTNAFISNNSWTYVGNDSQSYDLHAASFDAAVRDALPAVPGSQPLLVVFSAGNGGGGRSDGTAGNPDSIATPGTAKNVITVGAIEQYRKVTNETWICSTVSGTNSCVTNQPWLDSTDASNQVAAFSARGPVGVGIEGKLGRLKPDVVAPGTFVISTESQQWDEQAYYNPTSSIWFVYRDIVVPATNLYLDSIFVPANTVQLNLFVVPNTNSPIPFPQLPIYINPTTWPTNTDQPVGTNRVSLPPDLTLSPVDGYWYYGIGNRTSLPVRCDLWTELVVTNEYGNLLDVLRDMNDSLGPWYRYESGTSMAAADVSGTLALMQEFFEQRLSRTNSPALMKALLINGARSVGSLYSFSTVGGVNSQGWGLVNLPTTLPGSLTNATPTTNAMVMVDQNPADALATGQSRTYKISLSPLARRQPLRVTLVWTDPPGNPVASLKLVNNLDLVVTNLDNTNYVYFGNDIPSRSDFTQVWRTNTAPLLDTVNNVENVYLTPSQGIGSQLSTNYSITVIGRRVNVNAVTAQTNNVSQDYALVISGGDGLVTNAISLDSAVTFAYSNQPLVIVMTNSFTNSPDFYGGTLFHQRAGASPQLLGTNTLAITNYGNALLTVGVTNQWRFYMITNDTDFTNAAFLTFLPANLAVPREGVFQPSAERATRPEADIDLYVAPPSVPNSWGLTNLDPAVVAAATKSVGRGGTETIVYSNASRNVYYLAVKSEDQQAAEYALLAVFSRNPFGNEDTNGVHLVGIPTYLTIPDGSPALPGAANVLAISISSMMVRRVIVTNVVAHELIADLLGNLSHGTDYSILNNHTCVLDGDACQTLTSYIFDDSDEHNVGIDPAFPYPNQYVQHTDGPSSLNTFAGKDGQGQWMLTMVDNATNHVGTNVSLGIFLERQPDLSGNGITATILPGACRNDFIEVPPNAVSLTVTVAVVSATGPIDYTIEVCPLEGGVCKSTEVTNSLGGSVVTDQADVPPLHAGTYRIRICNVADTAITVNIRAVFGYSLNTIQPIISTSITSAVPILDDAVTSIFLTNKLHGIISSVDVGLLITDPRISDLAITLISPNGTRVLLFENRGAASTEGLGTFNLGTNYLLEPFFTNSFDVAATGLYTTGAVFEGWSTLSNFVQVLDDHTCLCLSNHILALFDGTVSNTLPTTNALPVTNANPHLLSFKVSHLPWLEGMVAWWPLDTDGADRFGGFDGLLLGDVAFSTGNVGLLTNDFDGSPLDAVWQPSLPNAGTGGGATPIETYGGAPGYTFTTVGTNTVLRLSNTLNPLERRGWSSGTIYQGQSFRYEVRFNTLTQGAGAGTGGLIELWILDAANSNRWDTVSLYAGDYGTNRALLAGSSIDNSYNTFPFNFADDTWYRLVLYALPNQGVHAAVLSDAGVELAGISFVHGAALFVSGFRVGLSQFVRSPAAASPVDVALDWLRLTSGLSGKVNQAYIGDGLLTRMIVPACPELDLGRGRGFAVEGWINPANLWTPGPAVMNDGFEKTSARFDVPVGAVVSGWTVEAGNIDVLSSSAPNNFAMPDSGTNCIDINGSMIGRISTNLSLVAGHTYLLSFAYSPNPHWTVAGVLPQAAINVGGTNLLIVSPNWTNTWNNLQWQHTSVVFTASATLLPLKLQGLSTGKDGVLFDSFNVAEAATADALPAPLVEWYDPAPATNQTSLGVQLWLSLSNGPGSLEAIIWDTNSVPHVITTFTNAITNSGWQHVALTYDTNSGIAALYVNGLTTNNQALVSTNLGYFEPRTTGNLYFGFHPPGLPAGACYSGGLDEFSLYNRALTPCEVKAIYSAGSRGKYGTNALVCPVVTEVTLSNSLAGAQIYTFTNGLSWVTNGPNWETNTIKFSTSTNPTTIFVRGLDPYNPANSNAANNLSVVVDEFVLSELVPQSFDGLFHFTEDTNLATLPIKFVPAPFTTTNFAPVLMFSNNFARATAGVYQVGALISGNPNNAALGPRDWTVTAGPVTVVSNAVFDAATTNWLAMATGAVQCLLPTIPGHRYELNYSVRGPCAVGWWDGSVEPLSQRAQDRISGNNGAFINSAAVSSEGYVDAGNGTATLSFPGIEWPPTNNPWYAYAPKVELGDPEELRFTNSFTIEGWINSVPFHSNDIGVSGFQQIFFRGDARDCADPYYLAMQWDPTWEFNLVFHVEGANSPGCGVSLVTTNHPVKTNTWMHVAAVFEANVVWTNNAPWPTNQMRLYLDGQLLTNHYLADPVLGALRTSYTGESPFADLDASYQPGITIGNSSRYDNYEPFCGYLDELSVYARALTGPEIAAIAGAGAAGKADLSVPAAQSLARVNVSVDGRQLSVGHGENSRWSTHSVQFTALGTNAVLSIDSLLPGTLLEGVTLTELAPELYYLPETSLTDLTGQDGYGVWTLEIWDNRAGGGTTNNAQLLQWVLNLGLAPSNPPPVITLSHGMPYTNSLAAHGVQYFVVPVPQWALLATNVLQFAERVRTNIPAGVTVFFNPTNYPTPGDIPLLIGAGSPGDTRTLDTNSVPPLVRGRNYYLAVTNGNAFGVTFALGVWFDITTLPNCQMVVSNIVSQAGIPRYFQFDVPARGRAAGKLPEAVSLWLRGADCNLKVVLSEQLPLPDLESYDYISQQPCTNDQVIMLVTNYTPFPILSNRWYVGVFNTGPTNKQFDVQACYTANSMEIITLTNGLPYVVPFTNSLHAAPPGPPLWFFYEFVITNDVPAVLFELYNLSGNADLVLEQDVPPTMAPYFSRSSFSGRTPEQIVVRKDTTRPSDRVLGDLRGHWYLGVYNNDDSNLTYTVRAILPSNDGLLPSAKVPVISFTQLAFPRGLLLSWNSVVGERYVIQYAPVLANPMPWSNIGMVTATTTLTTFEVLPVPTGGFYRIVQVYAFQPRLKIQLWSGNQVRISWSTIFPGYTLQYKLGLFGTWADVAFPPATGVFTEADEYVVYDPIGVAAKFYRLIK